ncbi:MAG: hypothetical protein C4560_08695 [Nitrospiraceae bacterium]|nr:MAG: hypothetical protein C4560_08695 [Nitrospiraceae bacterium]
MEVYKYDIGCGKYPESGYIGVDPFLGNSFWDLNSVHKIEELRFIHSIYMLNNNFKRKEDMDFHEIRRELRKYMYGNISIFELNERIFGKDNFINYYTQLKIKLKYLVDKMSWGGKIVIEQPVIDKMVKRHHGIVKELYRIVRYNVTSEKEGITAEFFRTHNFMTCDKDILVDLLKSVDMKDIFVRDGILDGSIHVKENSIVVRGTK